MLIRFYINEKILLINKQIILYVLKIMSIESYVSLYYRQKKSNWQQNRGCRLERRPRLAVCKFYSFYK